MIDKEAQRQNRRRLNLLPSELEAFVNRVHEGLYTRLEKDLILSRIEVSFNIEDGIPESKGKERYFEEKL